MILNQEPLALGVEMYIKGTNPALVGTCSKSAGEKITGIQRRTWDTGILWDTEPGYSKARCRTLTPETQWWAMGGRKNGTLLSPANIVLLSFHIAKSVNIRREDASVLESYFLKRATPVSRKQAGKNNDFFHQLVEYKIEPGASVYSDYSDSFFLFNGRYLAYI